MENIVSVDIDMIFILVCFVIVDSYIIVNANIRIVLVKDLWGPLIVVRCRFAKHCPLYQKGGHTCETDEEAIWYCGTARAFREIKFIDVRDLR